MVGSSMVERFVTRTQISVETVSGSSPDRPVRIRGNEMLYGGYDFWDKSEKPTITVNVAWYGFLMLWFFSSLVVGAVGLFLTL